MDLKPFIPFLVQWLSSQNYDPLSWQISTISKRHKKTQLLKLSYFRSPSCDNWNLFQCPPWILYFFVLSQVPLFYSSSLAILILIFLDHLCRILGNLCNPIKTKLFYCFRLDGPLRIKDTVGLVCHLSPLSWSVSPVTYIAHLTVNPVFVKIRSPVPTYTHLPPQSANESLLLN